VCPPFWAVKVHDSTKEPKLPTTQSLLVKGFQKSHGSGQGPRMKRALWERVSVRCDELLLIERYDVCQPCL